jgi:peptide/nickel transport system substrate-binding protein
VRHGPAHRTARWAAALLLACLAAAGPSAGAPIAGGTLTIGFNGDPTTLDPHTSAAAATYVIGSLNVVESLLYQRGDGTLVPWLAESSTVSADGRAFTFTLRSDARFSDGTPVNAQAVKWNLDRIVDPHFKAGGAIAALHGYTGAAIVDARTVRVRFADPFAPFLTYVAGGTLGLLSPAATAGRSESAATQPTGSGAFTVAEYRPQDHVTLVRNSAYNRRAPWSDHAGPPYLDRVVWKIIPEDETRAITVQSGETQMIYLLGYGSRGVTLDHLRGDRRLAVDVSAFPGSAYLWLVNVRLFPTDDVQVRRAIAYAMNRPAIINSVYKGLGSPACGLLSHTLLRDPEMCGAYRHDPAKAADLLQTAGWQLGPNHVWQKNGRPLRLVINSLNSGAGNFPDVELVQGQLGEAGMDVAIKSQTIGPRTEDNFKCADNLGTIFLRSTDPDTLYALFHSSHIGTNFNWSCYASPEVDGLLAQARSELDPVKRRALYVRLDHILMDQVAAVPLMDVLSVWIRRINVKGVRYNFSTYPALTDAYLEH